MNLIIDVGNTAIKFAVFEKKDLLFDTSTESEKFIENVVDVFKSYPDVTWAIISSVGNLSEQDVAALSNFCQVHVLSHSSKIPFKNLYDTPQTLGVDRIALATAAFYNNHRANTLVIDAGTCVTYDMVNDDGEYLGGAISPGLNMRYKALHNQTSKLPLLKKTDLIDFIGNSSETSIQSGVINGLCIEIDGVIAQYKLRFSQLTVILTGGDGQFLSKRLKNTIFADPKFLLTGLNYLLEYNKS